MIIDTEILIKKNLRKIKRQNSYKQFLKEYLTELFYITRNDTSIQLFRNFI